ncbi:MAG: bifunctional adenosylcobinamide kinase/adenosylcobinamide-phosphate guanylyltransferase [Deltaproteobacteria bacterium]|nr:bifunctional adenosylcobinamide kinase/adenosylcobinamide-phosphate guanylyltransferase [Deltaproteobacteria bacterium]
MQILLVTGGCRCGKSRFAQDWAERQSVRRLFLATAAAWDDEMRDRVKKHQAERGPDWITVEETLDPVKVINRHHDQAGVILMDCVTIWLSNLIMADLSDDQIRDRVKALVDCLARAACPVALVTNEVGCGIVPDNPLARRFRDLAGMANQLLAAAADRVVLLVSGIPVTIKGLES